MITWWHNIFFHDFQNKITQITHFYRKFKTTETESFLWEDGDKIKRWIKTHFCWHLILWLCKKKYKIFYMLNNCLWPFWITIPRLMFSHFDLMLIFSLHILILFIICKTFFVITIHCLYLFNLKWNCFFSYVQLFMK